MTESTDYLTGKYDAYRLLLTSPRMNKPQRDVIEDLALDVKVKLEAAGVSFVPAEETP